uniref:IQ calmodulin-binding domain containing protein n=2 Tax=Babesia bovis TaxID=5865 RepID=A7ANH0_BABBO|eukprot:XP_001611672.1 IQ calmodulin-binding domain containing protein [Babesia bovis T2Bo]
MTEGDATRVLNNIPPHEIKDPEKHTATLEQIIRNLLRIGFTAEEVRSIMQIIAAVVLFDLYTIMRERIDQEEERRKENYEKDIETTKRKSKMEEQDRPNKEDVLNPKDILIFAAEVMDIPLLKVPAKTLQSHDLLFRLDLLGAENRWQFENVAPALFIRLKLTIYRRANRYLAKERQTQISSSIAIHSNAGCFPQTIPVKRHKDIELAKRASEETFVHQFTNSMDGVEHTNAPTGDFVRKSADAVKLLASETGLIARIVVEAQNNIYDGRNDDSIELGEARTVNHSCCDVEYDLTAIAKEESKTFALPQGVAKLLAYTTNNFIMDIMASSRSRRTVYGTCAMALSYMRYLKEAVSKDDLMYHVVCTNPEMLKYIYRKEGDPILIKRKTVNEETSDKEADEYTRDEVKYGIELLKRALSVNMPVVELCITQREYSQVTLDLEAALNTFIPIAYVALQTSMHRTIPILEGKEIFRLMFHALRVPDTAYRITNETIVLKRALCVKLMARVSRYLNAVLSSARLIQSWWIGYNTIQLKRILRKVVVRLQSKVRQLIFQDKVVALANSRNLSVDYIGYCLVMYYLKVSLQSSSQKTLQLLHSMEKRYHEKEYNYIQHAAATYIQAVWRGRLQRRKYAQMKREKLEDFAIMLVQTFIRRFIATAKLIHKKPTKDIAATRIQAAFRGYIARKQYEVLSGLKLALLSIVRKGSMLISLNEQLKFVKERKKLNSTTIEIKRLIMMQTNLPPGFIKAQNMIRMHFVRKQYLYLRSAIDKVHAIAMTKIARLEYLHKVKSAVKIQRWWRSVRKPTVSSIANNVIYYINIKEHAAMMPMKQLCQQLGVTIFHFRAYQDLRNVYPRSWAAYPTMILNHLLQIQKTLIETGGAEYQRIEAVQFAVSAYHTLMLVEYAKGAGSALYAWGAPNVLHSQPLKNPPVTYLEKPLEFYQLENPERSEYGRHQFIPMENVEIVAITCGNEFSVALDKQGRVFTWGNNRYGQCGQGHRLVQLWSPTLLPMHGVTGIWCGESHAVIRLSVGEYFVFGKAFGYIIYTPEDIKAHCEDIKNQTIEAVACGGDITVLYTTELKYVLRVLGGEPTFANCYNLKGNIKSVCTNGRMICTIIEEVEYMGNKQQTLLAWGQLRCFSTHYKEPLPNTAVLVNAFCEMFEHPEKRKPKRSLNKVDYCLAKPCLIPMPTPINFNKRVNTVTCDHQQIVMTCKNGIVIAMKTFELIHSVASDIRSSDDHSIRLEPNVTNARLEPGLYQFTALERTDTAVQIAYNRLSCSIGFATGPHISHVQ